MQSLGSESQKYNSFNVQRFGGWLAVLIAAWTVCPAGRARGADVTNNPPSSPSDPVLDLMLEKGMITEDEAAKVQAQVDARRTNMAAQFPASAWKVSPGIKNLELYGDARLRFEDRSATDPAGNNIDLQRERYALRVGVRGDLFDDYYFGFRLETSSNPRSTWVTMGTSSSGTYQGPFGKSNAGIDIGQIYLGWRPQDWVNITLGKMSNPLYTTSMVWDGDLNPEGAAEHFKYTVGEADLFANFGQFLYADFNPVSADSGLGVNGLLGQNTENIFMFAWQGGVNYHITQDTSAKIAATLYNYTGLQRSSVSSGSSTSPYFGDPYVGEGAYYYAGGSARGYAPGYGGYSSGATGGAPGNFVPGYGSVSYPFNQVGLNDLLVVEVPFELNFKINKLNARVFGDFAYNLDGAQRAKTAASAYSYISSQAPPTQNAIPHSFAAQTQDVKAYQIGFALGSQDGSGLLNGSVVKKHAWEISTFWQHTEQYALDPNIIDSDIFEGRENMQGICASLAYGLTDNLIATIRYAHASRINNRIGTGGSNQDIPQMNPMSYFDLFQVDLGVKF